DVKPQAYRNAYDIPRRNLLDQLTRMRSNLLRKSQKLIRGQDEDYLHSIPVAQMGNYQEYLKMMLSPLREIDPDQPKRLHTFGNPFKQDKKAMVIDEADEFVTGHQNKKRGNSGDPNSSAIMKRRRSMSPLLRRLQTPAGNTNHVVGKSPAGVQGQQNLLKPTPPHKGVDGNDVVAESNGDGVHGSESGEIWHSEVDAMAVTPPSLPLVEKGGVGVADQGEDMGVLEEDGVDERPVEDKHNCDRLSPLSQEGAREDVDADADTDTDPAALETIFISPLDGSQAELRSRVIKEVRKPGRNFEAIFRLLQQVKGPVNVQRYFIQHAIREAVRFKKRVLIQQLETALFALEENDAAASRLPNDHSS
ncbi:hypothetical protein LDENG_00126520, partial [Lucifuga dentata]